MDRASKLLPNVLRKRGLFEQVNASRVTGNMKTWLLERFPMHKNSLRVTTLTHGVLCIEADNAIAMHECNGAAKEIEEYVKTALEYGTLKGVRVMRAR